VRPADTIFKANRGRLFPLPGHSLGQLQVWLGSQRDLVDVLEQVQRRTTKIIRGLQYLSYKDRLRIWGCSAWRREGSGVILEQPAST